MPLYYTDPNEFSLETDSQNIQAAVNAAHENGCNHVVIPRINGRTGQPLWVIDTLCR